MSSSARGQSERREYFRITDDVTLRARKIENEDDMEMLRGRLCDAIPDQFMLAASFISQSADMQRLLHNMPAKSHDLTAYLARLDNKLNRLAQHMVLDSMHVEERPLEAVNLSAGGVAFHGEAGFSIDDMLEMRMVLYPDLVGILAIARVVGCEPETTGGFQIAVEFSEMRERDRDLLVKHAIHRDTMLRRKEREAEG
ncbi:MAG TPA: PilZ domain-containing protein [Gammaproteobacteria bacterium]|nr:PilZ domain-containing protein [Gammaproteobacteria bacterium]